MHFGKVTVSKNCVIVGSADSLSKKFREDLYALIKEVVEGNKTATKQDKKEKA